MCLAYTPLPGTIGTAVGNVKHAYTVISLGVFIAYGAAIIGRSIINQNQFEIGISLVYYTIYTFFNRLFRFKNGYYYCD